ncbi:hypothetical protein CC85DRAFT_285230 [Cutaneotrichosporon oleaginosum]|uniref:Uncharacterized protein n=1 Tax=Cutaneotrichosporon oleaginosum TaxID=879819 RepID=A0A0J0XNM6_9TREE|nr:uncharacterized protein CC85DRAFT_285230 [Cutaneotrichosporon oleaginosum]KLT42687.1 hypothetical protein CC85DRAFT_285230 [Cutaneotrichosporon oleaginosum]TXT09592.1 hypothetical protein COLE_03526 [Cutaneotrichosporon oleaginosum]
MATHYPLPSPPASPTPDADAADSSPLADYLAQAEQSFDDSPPADDTTIRRRRPRSRERIAPLATTRKLTLHPSAMSDTENAEAGPSHLASPARIDSPPRDEFAERFKYLVASSGLLEKTQIASLGTTDVDVTPSKASVASYSHTDAPGAAGIPELLRWDIIAAIAAVVAGIVYILGPVGSVIPGTALATGVALYARRIAEAPTEGAAKEGNVPEANRESSAPERAVHNTTGRARVMRGLEGLLDESKALDQTVLAALQILARRPDDTDHAHELRIALHRLFEDMTDSLATATSSLTTMCDRSELTVLSNMYDVQLVGGQRRRRPSSSDEEDASPSAIHKHNRPRAGSSGPMSPPASLPASLLSPTARHARTPIRALAPPFDANDRFTKLPSRASPRFNRTSYSVDWNARPQRPFRSETDVRSDGEEGSDSVLSAASTESSCMPASIPDDRSLAGALSPPLVLKGLPFTPKRASPLIQTLARLEMPEWSRQPPTPSFHSISATPGQSPFRRSLQDIAYIPSPPVSSHEQAQNLAVARATTSMSSDKRRSLQTPFGAGYPAIDYTRDDVALATSSNLTRTRSLPHSDTARVQRAQTAASSMRTSPGSNTTRPDSPSGLRRLSLLSDRTRPSIPSTPGSKRTSLLFPDAMTRDASSLGYGRSPLRPPPMQRGASISPLTLGGLRASCLGVHLKRRRMACCLLGLRFREPEESGYWDEVDLVLRGVMDTMSEAIARLEALRADAEREAASAQAIAAAASKSYPATPPPKRGLMSLLGNQDFAPRDSTEQAVLSSMDDLQHLLARVWAKTEEVRGLIVDGESDLSMVWADMRNDIGNMLRHVDRNRLRLEATTDADSPEREETPVPPRIPEFARSWAEPEPGPGPEEIERLVEEDDEADTAPDLPPAGVDEVFEAHIPAAATRARSALSREERIQLQREARARGMTMAQLEGAKDPARAVEIQRQLEAERLRAVSGEMVQELQGMFGAIRRRKGMDEGDAAPEA